VNAPIIGLSAYCERAHWAVWDAPAVLLPVRYSDQVLRAGGVPVLLPPVPGVAAAAGRLDGLILTGGGDVDPARYGDRPHPRLERVSAGRDEAELSLLAAALAAGLPILGICRGMQLLNVARGGTLRQHLPDDSGHRHTPGTFGSHQVRVAPGSRLAQILGHAGTGGEISVPTSHHQAVGRLGEGLAATAWATDGVIEAVELDQALHPFALGVQWHPEAGEDPRLFEALIGAASRSGDPAPAGGPLHSPA
jgi:putative glutamine amidotransferase